MSDYDGQGKSRRQEEIDSMWIIVYLLVALVLAVATAVGLGLWWVL